MDPAIRAALNRGGVIDITTTGRRTGRPRRIEIVLHNIGGRPVISGQPRRDHTRAWIRNLQADPRLTVHLKRGVTADLAATARVVTDEAERRELLVEVARSWRRTDLDAMVAWSPLIVLSIPGYGPADAASGDCIGRCLGRRDRRLTRARRHHRPHASAPRTAPSPSPDPATAHRDDQSPRQVPTWRAVATQSPSRGTPLRLPATSASGTATV